MYNTYTRYYMYYPLYILTLCYVIFNLISYNTYERVVDLYMYMYN